MTKQKKILDLTINYLVKPHHRVELVNFLCVFLGGLTSVYGLLFYLLTGNKTIAFATWIEGVLFMLTLVLNKSGYNLASRFILILINCAAVVYFSAALGKMTEVHLLLFFFAGITYLFFDNRNEQLSCVAAILLCLFLCELNFFAEYSKPIIDLHAQFVTRWLAIPAILVLDGVVIYLIILKLMDRMSAFIATSCHEMKVPMASMQRIVDDLVNGSKEDVQLKSLAAAVSLCSENLTSVLETAKEHVGFEIEIENKPLVSKVLFHEIVQPQSYLAQSAEIDIVSEVDLPYSIVSDRVALNRITSNLLSNAINHSPRNGKVRMKAFMSGPGKLLIQVLDSGKGIPKGDVDKIFSSYYTEGGRGKGTGLGLSIVKRYVSALGGTIQVVNLLKGACFTVEIPVTIGTEKEPPQHGISGMATAPPKVLLIEDDVIFRKLMTKKLLASGCEVRTADDIKMGIQHAVVAMPDVIVMDMLTSKELSGIDALKIIRSDDRIRHIPIVVISGNGMRESIIAAEQAGASAYLVKPINFETLNGLIQGFCPVTG